MHSRTIFVVGGAGVRFKLAFTPRLGLSMEFCVALMLMALGYLNLTRHGPSPRPCPTLAIAAPAIYVGARLTGLQRGICVASGAVSLAFGAYLGYTVGFVDGLFTAQPHWTPQ